MCDLAFEKDPIMMVHFPDRYKTQEMCDKAFEKEYCLVNIPDQFITQKMCDKAVEKSPYNIYTRTV